MKTRRLHLGVSVKSIHRPSYAKFLQLLAEERTSAACSQAELAERLKKQQSYVSKIETGERRLDLIEFVDWANALDADPVALLRRLLEQIGGGKRRRVKLHRRD